MEENKVNEQSKDDLVEVDNVEIAPLSDEDLDSASGGNAAGASISPLEGDCTGCGNTGCCTSA